MQRGVALQVGQAGILGGRHRGSWWTGMLGSRWLLVRVVAVCAAQAGDSRAFLLVLVFRVMSPSQFLVSLSRASPSQVHFHSGFRGWGRSLLKQRSRPSPKRATPQSLTPVLRGASSSATLAGFRDGHPVPGAPGHS